jgi:hypothetical protein
MLGVPRYTGAEQNSSRPWYCNGPNWLNECCLLSPASHNLDAKMEYGQIAGNRAIDAKIKYCFQFMSPADVGKFVKRFASLPEVHDTRDERLHVFRELIIGAYLGSEGFQIEYARLIEEKTPDWTILGQGGDPIALIEVVTFHCGVGKTSDRLYTTVQGKFSVYKELADRCGLPYIVGIHVDFEHDVDESEISECLLHDEYGLFALYPEVSGAIFFVIMRASYPMTFHENPHAKRPFVIRSGIF